jgi:Carbohydrate esterase, sialic acid-specific acetylesterase
MKQFVLQLLYSIVGLCSVQAGLAITGGQSNSNWTVGEYFAKRLPGTQRPVNAMAGGTSIDEWLTADGKGGYERGPRYLTLLWDPGSAEATAEKVCHETAVQDEIYFLWMQGETDSLTMTAAESYEGKLRALLDFVKMDFGFVKQLKMAVGLIWYAAIEETKPAEEVPGVYRVRAAQRKVAEDLGIVWVDSAGLTRFGDVERSGADRVHLNYVGESPGCIRLGEEAAYAIRRQQNYHADQGVYLVQGAHEIRGVRGMRYLLESSADGITWKSCGNYRIPYVSGPEAYASQRLPWPEAAGPDDLKLRYRISEMAP